MSKVKVRSVYYSPKGERGIGKWIVGWTWVLGLFYNWKVLKYSFSHEEIWVADENGRFTAKRYPDYDNDKWGTGITTLYFGQCFSSTTRGDANGVRFAPASEVIGKHPKRWMYIEWECEQEDLERVLPWMKEQVGKKYDYAGVKGFVNPFRKQVSNEIWYCSEICDFIKWLMNLYEELNGKVSPRRSAYLLAKKTGREPKPLVDL